MSGPIPTPAPWTVRASNEYGGTYSIIECYAWEGEEECEANIAFIGATHDLYDALWAMYKVCANAIEPGPLRDATLQAWDALEKAQGQGRRDSP